MEKELKPVYVDYIPEVKEENILYISKTYNIAIHLCACGCGIQAVTPLGAGEWTLIENGDKVSLRPSIGNFIWDVNSKGEKDYHAHYFITDNKVIFV